VHVITCTATDASSNTSTSNFTVTVLSPLQVVFQSPLSDDNIANNFTPDCADAAGTPQMMNYFTCGSTIPHKVKLLDCSGNDVTDAMAPRVKVTIQVTERTGSYYAASSSNTIPTTYTGTGDTGGRMVLTDHQFHYNLKTTGYRTDTDNDGKGSNDLFYFQTSVRVEYLSDPGIVVGQENVILESR
jgi:hypothetical protein